MTLKQKVALVTGSTSGIGLGIARALAAEGCHLMLNGFGDAAEINALQKQLQKEYGIQTDYSAADLSKPEQIQTMIHQAAKRWGKIDILVNNAGIQHVDNIQDFPPEKWDAVISINLSAVFHTIRHSIPLMQKNKFGRIINIASAHGLVASAKKSAYVAAKHGVVGLTKVVALENAEHNVTCNAICPGWVLTPLVQKQIDAIAEREHLSNEEASVKLLSEKQPSKRFVRVEQLGALSVFLCSDVASGITGSAYSMDGGWTAQ